MLSPPDGEPGSRSFIEAASSVVRLSRVWQGLSDVDAAKSGAIYFCAQYGNDLTKLGGRCRFVASDGGVRRAR